MPTKHPYLWMAALGALAAGLLGHELRQRQDIEALTDSATRLLQAPISRAPELQDIEAARARAFLDGALAVREQNGVQGMRDYASALAYFQKQDFVRARDRLERSTRLLGDSADSLVLEAAIGMQEGEGAGGQGPQTLLDRALQLQAHHPRATMLLADIALDAGDAERALALSEAAIARDPKAASALNRRGLAHELQGRLAAAREDFEAAGELHARLPHAHLNLGRVLQMEGSHARAEQAFAEATRRAPGDPMAWLGLGLSRVVSGDPIGGRMDIQRARNLAPSEPDPLLALADLDLAEGERERALLRYRAALALDPEHAGGWVKLGNALIRGQEAANAKEAFERAIASDDQLAPAHNGLGAALVMLGEHESAAMALATAAGLDRSDPNPLMNLVRLRMKTGDLAAARQAQAQALARDPELSPLL